MRRYLRLLCSVPSRAKELGGLDGGLSTRARSGTQRARPTLPGRSVSSAADARYPACARETSAPFLRNPRLDPRSVTTDWLGSFLVPVVGTLADSLRPNQSRSYTSFVCRSPFSRPGPTAGGLHLPISVQEKTARSQNQLKKCFLAISRPPCPFVCGRVHWGSWLCAGSAAPQSNRQGRLYIIRGRAGTRVEYQGRSCKLAELPGEDRRAIRYPRVLYQRESVSRSMWWSITIRNSRNLGGYWFPVRAAPCYQFAR